MTDRELVSLVEEYREVKRSMSDLSMKVIHLERKITEEMDRRNSITFEDGAFAIAMRWHGPYIELLEDGKKE